MKVFAEYFDESEIKYRKNTLLQFGTGWNLIGNVVLANPGSADPIAKVSSSDLTNLSNFYKNIRSEEIYSDDAWYEFSPDSTMGFVEKIFNGWYLGEQTHLNGVIQLFNTFNIKNQNISEAINRVGQNSNHLFSRDIQKWFHDKPTYFGFGKDVLSNNILREVAKNIFDNSSKRIVSMYSENFSANSFYHPMYINRAFRQKHFQKYKNGVLTSLFNEM